jgi:hypothetical protein
MISLFMFDYRKTLNFFLLNNVIERMRFLTSIEDNCEIAITVIGQTVRARLIIMCKPNRRGSATKLFSLSENPIKFSKGCVTEIYWYNGIDLKLNSSGA